MFLFHSNLFSTSCLCENIPSVVLRPFLKPLPLYFPGSCASPFLFHMGKISPVRQSLGTVALFHPCGQQPLCPSGNKQNLRLHVPTSSARNSVPAWYSPFFIPFSHLNTFISVTSITFTFSCTLITKITNDLEGTAKWKRKEERPEQHYVKNENTVS